MRPQSNPQFCDFHDSIGKAIEPVVRRHYHNRVGVLAAVRAIASQQEDK